MTELRHLELQQNRFTGTFVASSLPSFSGSEPWCDFFVVWLLSFLTLLFRSVLQAEDFETNCLDCPTQSPSTDSKCTCAPKRPECQSQDSPLPTTAQQPTTTTATTTTTTSRATPQPSPSPIEPQPQSSHSRSNAVTQVTVIDSSQSSPSLSALSSQSPLDRSTAVSNTFEFFENSEGENSDELNIPLIAGSAAAGLVCCVFLLAVCATTVLMFKRRHRDSGLIPQLVDYNPSPYATTSAAGQAGIYGAAPPLNESDSAATTTIPRYTNVANSAVVNHYDQPDSRLD
jgi:hypothetical protein